MPGKNHKSVSISKTNVWIAEEILKIAEEQGIETSVAGLYSNAMVEYATRHFPHIVKTEDNVLLQLPGESVPALRVFLNANNEAIEIVRQILTLADLDIDKLTQAIALIAPITQQLK